MPDGVNDEQKTLVHHVRVGLPGGAVHDVEVDADAQLSSVVSKVQEIEKLDPSIVRVRLIVAGKLFPDHSQLLRDVVPDGGFIHCAISELTAPNPHDPTVSSSQTSQTHADREVRIPIETHNVDGEVRIVIPSLNSQIAYDRLLRAGFTTEEIRMIRRHVRTLRREALGRSGGGTAAASITATGLEQNERGEFAHDFNSRRGHVHSLVTSGREGTNSDFLMGCIFGYLLGIIILVLLLDNNATRRWRVGIIAGVATNCAFGVLRSNLYLQASFPAP